MAFDYQKDGQDIVTVTMDMPGRSANVINDEFSLSMMTVVDKLEREDSLSGIIITSAKKTFLAGGDLEMLITQEDPEKTFELVEKGKKITRKLETLGKPVVAAINGAALGGGLELALCCHYRIAIDNSQMNIGLPEVTLGLLPGGGGVARLPRLIGLQSSFPFLIEGKQVNPAAAFNEGIINELASDNGDMLKKAKDWILSKPEAVQPWDKRGYICSPHKVKRRGGGLGNWGYIKYMEAFYPLTEWCKAGKTSYSKEKKEWVNRSECHSCKNVTHLA